MDYRHQVEENIRQQLDVIAQVSVERKGGGDVGVRCAFFTLSIQCLRPPLLSHQMSRLPLPPPPVVQDPGEKQRLIAGKKVALSEEIEVLRHIHSKLDAFIKALRAADAAGGAAGASP